MCVCAQLLRCVWQKGKGEKRKREGIKKAGSVYYKAHTLWGNLTLNPEARQWPHNYKLSPAEKEHGLRIRLGGNFPCGLPASTAGSTGLIPGRGTKISHAACHVIQ